MKIRSVTLGINWGEDDAATLEGDIKKFFKEANGLLAGQRVEPRTLRITLPPFIIKNDYDCKFARSSVEHVSVLCKSAGIRWFCVPFYAVGQEMSEINAFAIQVAKEYKNAFINYIVTEDRKLDINAVFHAARFVRSVSQLSSNGFDNFRCGVSFNCEPNGAFFPFAYHSGENGFSIALELAPLCVETIRSKQGKPLQDIRSLLVEALLPVVKQVDEISKKLETNTGMKYFGIDASLAPHPEHPDNSVAYIVELMGVDRFGSNGTTFVTGFLTDIINSLIERSGIRSTGFNCIMYSLLEDPRLSEVNNEKGSLSIDSLLAFAALCGCGIDMVPVPGDTSEQELASIMLDVAALAIRLNKALGVRLLPIPGKSAGDFTDFDHDFLKNTRIKEVRYHSCLEKFFEAEQLFRYLSG